MLHQTIIISMKICYEFCCCVSMQRVKKVSEISLKEVKERKIYYPNA